ncbi:MAG: hypothetical protein RI885_2604 [Actinomycetota bacterium]
MVTGLIGGPAPRAVGRAHAQALHATAFTVLAGAAVVALVLQVASPEKVVWPAVVALVPHAAMLALANRSMTVLTTVAYLVVGAGSVYAFTLTIGSQFGVLDATASDATVHALSVLPTIALLLVGGAGVGLMAGFAWCTAGYLLGSLASSLAMIGLGLPVRLDLVVAGMYLFAVVVLLLVWFSSRAERRASPGLARAAGEQLSAQLRSSAEARSAALLHDTVLSHLTAVANSTSGIPTAMRDQMRRDLDVVLDEAWLDVSHTPFPDRAGSPGSTLLRALRDGGTGGLDVGVTGDPGQWDRLDAHRRWEVTLAIRQCLENVRNHAGVADAEIAVSGSDAEVLVMVIDTGRGFVEHEVPDDRLGLRASVRGRIADLGGSVQVWSTPGLGTSVIIRIPVVPTSSPQGSSSLIARS